MKSIDKGKILWFALLFISVVFCIRELREPDLWWQLRTGEWMLENHAITKTDIFSYTYGGSPWINVKWGYEVILAYVSNFMGPEGSMFLQMIAIVLTLVFLRKVFFLYHKKSFYNNAAFVLAGLLLLLTHATRINGRPEMTTYLLTCVFLYIFQRHKIKQDWVILLLIPIQVFWTNMHEAYGVGIIIMGIFLFGQLTENLVLKKLKVTPTTINKKSTLSIIAFLGVIFATFINPNGAQLFGHYIEIYSQLQENKFTTEIYNFTKKEYWTVSSILSIAVFFLTLKHIYPFWKKDGKKKLISTIQEWGWVFILIYFAFFYLSLQAVRNTFFFMAIATPFMAMNFAGWIKEKKQKNVLILTATILLLTYVGTGSGYLYKAIAPLEQYGLKISSKRNAIGPAKFLRENNIQGKGFTDYLNSSYLIWANQPDFKSYMDLRDLDIFPHKFMENVFMAYQNPGIALQSDLTLWQAMQIEDTFSYIVMSNNEQFINFNRFILYSDTTFQLVYADGVASVYLSKIKYPELCANLSWENKKDRFFHTFQKVETKGWAKWMTRICWPFYTEHYVSDQEELLTQRAFYRMIQ